MLAELLAEVAEEARTPAFAIEVVQFVLLIAIVWVVAVGFGKRRGFVANMLSERHAKTLADILAADEAPDELARQHAYAAARKKSARAEARHLLVQVKAEIARAEDEERARVDAEAESVLARADETLSTETNEMRAELREQMVELVTQATRRILNERMTLSEQRRLIEEHVKSAAGGLGGTGQPVGTP